MARMTHAQVVQRLKQATKDIRCSEMKRMLNDLGFQVKPRSNGNHRTFTHPQLKGFFGSNYDCGHGSDSKLKPQYVRNVVSILEQYESELKKQEP